MAEIGNIIMVIAKDSCGKTKGVGSFPEEIAILDLDNKAQNTIDAFYPDSLITVFSCMAYHKRSDPVLNVKRGDIDINQTVVNLRANVLEILDNFEQYETVVIDPVSDLSKIFTKYWLMHDPKKRKTIGEFNIGARAEINSWIKNDVIFPLVHVARELNKTLIMTSKVTDVYKLIPGDDGIEHSIRTGEKTADCKDFIPYQLDAKVTLTSDDGKGKYFLTWNRSLVDGLKGTHEITGQKLYDVFVNNGVLS